MYTLILGIDGCLARRLGQTSAFGAWVSSIILSIISQIIDTIILIPCLSILQGKESKHGVVCYQ